MADSESLRIRRRAVWTSDTGQCTACDAEFPLEDHHYVFRSQGRVASSDAGRSQVFCSHTCATLYLNDKAVRTGDTNR